MRSGPGEVKRRQAGESTEDQGAALKPARGFAPWTPSKGRAFAIHPLAWLDGRGPVPPLLFQTAV